MEKESNYFSHDFNARNDDKILMMIQNIPKLEPACDPGIVRLAGYGLYWTIIEMLNETTEKKLPFDRLGAVAMQAHCKVEFVNKFVNLCCDKPVNLFKKNNKFYWSESVKRRAALRENKKKQNQLNASKKRKIDSSKTEVERSLSSRSPTAKQNDAKKERKEIKKQINKVSFISFKELEKMNKDDQIAELYKLWNKSTFDMHIDKVYDLLNEYGIKDLLFAFKKAKEQTKGERNCCSIPYVKGILERKNKKVLPE